MYTTGHFFWTINYPAEASAKENYSRMVELILKGHDVNDKKNGDYGYSSLSNFADIPAGGHSSVCPYFAACMMLWLINKGANVNVTDNNDKNPGH